MLSKTILRKLPKSSYKIFINDINVNELNLNELQQIVAYIPSNHLIEWNVDYEKIAKNLDSQKLQMLFQKYKDKIENKIFFQNLIIFSFYQNKLLLLDNQWKTFSKFEKSLLIDEFAPILSTSNFLIT